MCKKKLALAVVVALTLFATNAWAQASGAPSNEFDAQAMAGLSAGLGIGLAVLGGGLGQGKAIAAALEGIGRNPGAAGKMLTPMILGLALIESLVLFGFVVAFTLAGKVPGVGG